MTEYSENKGKEKSNGKKSDSNKPSNREKDYFGENPKKLDNFLSETGKKDNRGQINDYFGEKPEKLDQILSTSNKKKKPTNRKLDEFAKKPPNEKTHNQIEKKTSPKFSSEKSPYKPFDPDKPRTIWRFWLGGYWRKVRHYSDGTEIDIPNSVGSKNEILNRKSNKKSKPTIVQNEKNPSNSILDNKMNKKNASGSKKSSPKQNSFSATSANKIFGKNAPTYKLNGNPITNNEINTKNDPNPKEKTDPKNTQKIKHEKKKKPILDPLNNKIIKDPHIFQKIIQNPPKIIEPNENKQFKKGIIYCLQNTTNRKIYIGKTISTINKRFNMHIHHARTHQKNPHLARAVEKYGTKSFKIHPLHTIHNQKHWVLNKMEIHYIAKFNARNRNIGYNIHEGGLGGPRSEETKAKISQTMKGRVSPMKGRKQTKEHIEKRMVTQQNKPKSPATRAKISQSLSGEKHPYYGKKLSDTHRENISSGRKNAHITLPQAVIDKQLKTKRNNYYRKHFSLQHLNDDQISPKIAQINNQLEKQIRSGKSLKQIAENLNQKDFVVRRMLHWKYNTRSLNETRSQLNIKHNSRSFSQNKPITDQKIDRDKFIKKIAQNNTYSEIMQSLNIQKKYHLRQLLEEYCGTSSLVEARSTIMSEKKKKKRKKS